MCRRLHGPFSDSHGLHNTPAWYEPTPHLCAALGTDCHFRALRTSASVAPSVPWRSVRPPHAPTSPTAAAAPSLCAQAVPRDVTTGRPLQAPCVGSECKHLQAFELRPFLEAVLAQRRCVCVCVCVRARGGPRRCG